MSFFSVDSDSSSHPLRTSGDQKPASELCARSQEQEERLIRKPNEKDTNSNNASQCEHKEGSTSEVGQIHAFTNISS